MQKQFPLLAPIAGVVVIWLFFLWNSWRGIDFGYHWDEKATTISIKETVETGVLLPTIYLYPGMCYDLSLIALLPEAYHELTTGETPWQAAPNPNAPNGNKATEQRSRFDQIQASLQGFVDQPEYLLTVRKLFAFVSSLLILWVFGVIWTMSGSAWAGLFGAGLAGLSWEYLYHSRWAVPDAITASFAALTLLLCALILKHPKRSLYYAAAAAAAGLCASSKYPGAIVMLSVSLAIFSATRKSDENFLKPLFVSWIWFVISFIVTSPGTILNPLRFFDGLQYNKHVYSVGHPGHTIEAGFPHFKAILSYLTYSVSSEQMLISAIVAIIALVGIFALILRKEGFVWLFMPFSLYILYMGVQNVFFVRNSLLLIPFWAVFTGIGAWYVWNINWLKGVMRGVIVALVVLVVVFNGKTILASTESVENRVDDRETRLPRFLDWVCTQSLTVCVSPRIAAEIGTRSLQMPKRVSTSFADAQIIACYLTEVNSYWPKWEAQHRQLFLNEFGPREVNLNYYPFWGGEDRIVVLDRAKAQSFGIDGFKNNTGPYTLYEQ